MLDFLPMSQITINYDPTNGFAAPDGIVKKEVHKFLLRTEKVVDHYRLNVGSSLFINYIRLAIKAGRVDPANIKFQLTKNSEFTTIDHSGNFEKPPRGFALQYEQCLAELESKK